MSLVESTVYANQLNKVVVGKKIVNQNQHAFVWFALEPSQAYCAHDKSNEYAKSYDKLLCNHVIKNADVNKGGYSTYTYLYIGYCALMFNSIKVLYHKEGESRPKRHQLLLELDDGCALSFCSSLGGPLFLFEVDKEENSINYVNDFPSILSDEFSFEFFVKLIKNTELRKLSAKAFLATKNRIPGITIVFCKKYCGNQKLILKLRW